MSIESVLSFWIQKTVPGGAFLGNDKCPEEDPLLLETGFTFSRENNRDALSVECDDSGLGVSNLS
jgi:hypothetical protein